MSTKLCQPETSGSMNCKNGLQLATSFSEVLIKTSFAGLVIKEKARMDYPCLGQERSWHWACSVGQCRECISQVLDFSHSPELAESQELAFTKEFCAV